MCAQWWAGKLGWHQSDGYFAISPESFGLQGLRVLTDTLPSMVSPVSDDFNSENRAPGPLPSRGHLLAILMELAA